MSRQLNNANLGYDARNADQPSSNGSGVSRPPLGNNNLVPLLTIPGGGSPRGGDYGGGYLSSSARGGGDEYNVGNNVEEKKKKSKVPKINNNFKELQGPAAFSNTADLLFGGDSARQPLEKQQQSKPSSAQRKVPSKASTPIQQQHLLDEEAGTGETAGPLDEWGFAIETKTSARGAGGPKSLLQSGEPEENYGDDDDFEPADDDGGGVGGRKNGGKKKKKTKKGGGVDGHSADGIASGGPMPSRAGGALPRI
jgi:hypothetical protein